MSFSQDRYAAGQSACDDIEKQRYAAFLSVSSTVSIGGWWDPAAKDAQVSYLTKTAPAALDELRSRLDRADDTDAQWAQWTNDAAYVQRTIAGIVNDTSEWSLLGVLKSTAGSTGQTVGNAVNNAVQGAGVGAGAVAFLVLAWVAWKVLG